MLRTGKMLYQLDSNPSSPDPGRGSEGLRRQTFQTPAWGPSLFPSPHLKVPSQDTGRARCSPWPPHPGPSVIHPDAPGVGGEDPLSLLDDTRVGAFVDGIDDDAHVAFIQVQVARVRVLQEFPVFVPAWGTKGTVVRARLHNSPRSRGSELAQPPVSGRTLCPGEFPLWI